MHDEHELPPYSPSPSPDPEPAALSTDSRDVSTSPRLAHTLESVNPWGGYGLGSNQHALHPESSTFAMLRTENETRRMRERVRLEGLRQRAMLESLPPPRYEPSGTTPPTSSSLPDAPPARLASSTASSTSAPAASSDRIALGIVRSWPTDARGEGTRGCSECTRGPPAPADDVESPSPPTVTLAPGSATAAQPSQPPRPSALAQTRPAASNLSQTRPSLVLSPPSPAPSQSSTLSNRPTALDNFPGPPSTFAPATASSPVHEEVDPYALAAELQARMNATASSSTERISPAVRERERLARIRTREEAKARALHHRAHQLRSLPSAPSTALSASTSENILSRPRSRHEEVDPYVLADQLEERLRRDRDRQRLLGGGTRERVSPQQRERERLERIRSREEAKRSSREGRLEAV